MRYYCMHCDDFKRLYYVNSYGFCRYNQMEIGRLHNICGYFKLRKGKDCMKERTVKYCKKAIVIEAREYTRNGIEAQEVAEWCGGEQTDEGCIIHTTGGDMLAMYGDFIIKGIKGEFYPCKPDIFKETYRKEV